MSQGKITILGIETSCDETAAAVVVGRQTTDDRRQKNHSVVRGLWTVDLLSNIVSSQVDLHAATGGVVPEIAARAHVEAIIPVIERALFRSKNSRFESPIRFRYSEASRNSKKIQNSNDPNSKRFEFKNLDFDIVSDFGFKISDLMQSIDAIAVTTGPGLIGSLLIGIETAKTLAYVFKKPIIPVNHLEGHIYANFVGEIPKSKFQNPNKSQIQNSKFQTNSLIAPPKSGRPSSLLVSFPALALIVSGGHTELVLMKNHLEYELVGQTRDDAAGECFDKTARLLGLPYPGGPALSKLAKQGDPKAFDFPRPMIDSDDDDFSFSGLKTAVYYSLRELDKNSEFPPRRRAGKIQNVSDFGSRNSNFQLKADLAASIQQAIVDVLIAKTIAVAKHYPVKCVMISGGVAANQLLRQTMAKIVAHELPSVSYRQPNLDLATDNAGMIAIAGIYRYLRGDIKNWYDVGVEANATLTSRMHESSLMR